MLRVEESMRVVMGVSGCGGSTAPFSNRILFTLNAYKRNTVALIIVLRPQSSVEYFISQITCTFFYISNDY